MADVDSLTSLFVSIGIAEVTARDIARNKDLSTLFSSLADSSRLVTLNDPKLANVVLNLASTIPAPCLPYAPFLADYIVARKLASQDQLNAAFKFLIASKPAVGQVPIDEFEKATGVGIVISSKTIEENVVSLLDANKEDLDNLRYRATGKLLGMAKSMEGMRWADNKLLKETFDRLVLARLGEKDDRDDPKKLKKAAKDAAKKLTPSNSKSDLATLGKEVGATSARSVVQLAKSLNYIHIGALSQLHKPGENPQSNTGLMTQHLKETGGKYVTRFPPEPNGYLHIGHAKAININFGMAQAHSGDCNLRYDDTNPTAEEQEYFDSILETIEWLGFAPTNITYSSDNFQKLYDLAVDLVKRGKAFVCHCTAEQMWEMRGGDKGELGVRQECSHRDRPIEESLREFKRMKEGYYKEGQATLRMKMDMQNGSPQFWDLVAYRVMFAHHVRTGDAWCIYPTYDYTHCLCDSFENITHSLCTTEFRLSRDSYYWLCDALEIYKPVQWEYGRLNITNTVLSKRKLMKLVEEGLVDGWDDPRLYTLMALRRRGFTPEAINAFVRDLGVTTSNTIIDVMKLEGFVRDHLNDMAMRLFCVTDPLEVVFTNIDKDTEMLIDVPNKPRDESYGTRKLPFTKIAFIDAVDFREDGAADKNFYRLAPGKEVGFLHVPGVVRCDKVLKDKEGNILRLECTWDQKATKKAKTYIQWIGKSEKLGSPVKATINLYSSLFVHGNPSDNPGGWMADVDKDSLVVKQGFLDLGIAHAKRQAKFQFVRVGYFCVDTHSCPEDGKWVLNRTVSLKEDSAKN